MSDSDGDGYRNSWEDIWGTDPSAFTSFEDLQSLPRVITGILHTREPYNLEMMNSTIYQQVRLIDEELQSDHQRFSNKVGPFSTLTVELVLFPYVTSAVNNYVKTLSFPYNYPTELKPFTLPSNTSDSCKEEIDMMKPLVDNSNTLYELSNKINNWNSRNLRSDLTWGNQEGQGFRSDITTCEMMKTKKIDSCMIFATKMVSDFREAGIPIGIAFSINVSDVDLELHEHDLEVYTIRSNFHPQNAIWTPRYGWVIYQYMMGFENTREVNYYLDLLFTDIVVDWDDLNTSNLFGMEKGQGYEWFYYSENISAPNDLFQYLQPVE